MGLVGMADPETGKLKVPLPPTVVLCSDNDEVFVSVNVQSGVLPAPMVTLRVSSPASKPFVPPVANTVSPSRPLFRSAPLAVQETSVRFQPDGTVSVTNLS